MDSQAIMNTKHSLNRSVAVLNLLGAENSSSFEQDLLEQKLSSRKSQHWEMYMPLECDTHEL